MAATVSHIADSVFGDQRVVLKKVTNGASSATADVATGLDHVLFAFVVPLQGGAVPSVRFNSSVAGVATPGTVALHSGTSAGSAYVVAFGA